MKLHPYNILGIAWDLKPSLFSFQDLLPQQQATPRLYSYKCKIKVMADIKFHNLFIFIYNLLIVINYD